MISSFLSNAALVTKRVRTRESPWLLSLPTCRDPSHSGIAQSGVRERSSPRIRYVERPSPAVEEYQIEIRSLHFEHAHNVVPLGIVSHPIGARALITLVAPQLEQDHFTRRGDTEGGIALVERIERNQLMHSCIEAICLRQDHIDLHQ